MKTFSNSKHILFAALAVASLAASAGAQADQASEVPTRTVHYSDLNLNTQAGASALYNRIVSAAKIVCGDVDQRRLDEVVAVKPCVDRAIAATVKAVNNPKLTTEYAARVGGTQKQINVADLR